MPLFQHCQLTKSHGMHRMLWSGEISSDVGDPAAVYMWRQCKSQYLWTCLVWNKKQHLWLCLQTLCLPVDCLKEVFGPAFPEGCVSKARSDCIWHFAFPFSQFWGVSASFMIHKSWWEIARNNIPAHVSWIYFCFKCDMYCCLGQMLPLPSIPPLWLPSSTKSLGWLCLK